MFVQSTQIGNQISKNRRPQILLVDDQVSDLYLLNSIFEFLQCQIDRATDGSEAIAKLQRKNYDLVVLDWLMPIKGGQDVMAIMDKKNRVRSKSMDLVVYTGLPADKINIPNSEYFHLVDLWEKPAELTNLLKRADSVIRRLHRR